MRISDWSSDVCSSDRSERLIVPLPLLVLDNAALVVEFLLRHRAQQMSHAVTFKKQGNFQSGSRHRFEIIGPVEPGGAIEVRGTDLLQRFKEITGGIFRSIEHQMYEKMRKACLALENGRASLRERVRQSVWYSLVA